MSITYCDCVCVALGIQHAMRMLHIAICGLPALRYFSTLSHKRSDFRQKDFGNTKCVLISSTTSVWNISHSKKNWARYVKKCILVFMYSTVICLSSCTVLLFVSDFNETWIFLTIFPKILKYQISPKSVQSQHSCSVRADGQTWRSNSYNETNEMH